MDVRKKLYDELMNELIKCRERNSLGFTQKATKPTKTLPAETQRTTTTIPPTTTSNPEECSNAVNLTGSWRLDADGQDLRGGGEHWFRFSKDSERKMLDYCPAAKSCGTRSAYWTDAMVPPAVGVAVKSRMYVISPSKSGSCKNGVYVS